MRRREIDRGQALARYAYEQLKQRIEALEEFERRGELSNRQLLIDAYEEQIQTVMQSDPELALKRAVWLLGDCLDRIDAERVELKQLDELYDRVFGIYEVFMWHRERIREYRALGDYLKRLRGLRSSLEREERRRCRERGSFDDPRMDEILREDMANWYRATMYGEEEAQEEEEEAPPAGWGAAEALREAHRIYNSYAAELGGEH